MNDEAPRYVLELFVADHTVRAKQISEAISAALERLAPGRYELSTINVLEHPERAVAAKVFATPMLIRISPPPSLRVLGDLADTARVLALLEMGEPTNE
jgi:circadian clock protein KaiB